LTTAKPQETTEERGRGGVAPEVEQDGNQHMSDWCRFRWLSRDVYRHGCGRAKNHKGKHRCGYCSAERGESGASVNDYSAAKASTPLHVGTTFKGERLNDPERVI
jgi:hypothetical protein